MKHTKAQIKDFKRFYKTTPDAGFSPKRNKLIIDGTIKKYEAMRARKAREYDDKIQDRADAVATYLKHLVQGKSTTVEKYFGRRELARLRGQRILQQIRGNNIRLREIE